MDLMILKKKIDGFRSGNGQLSKLPPELLYELRQAWEDFTGPSEEIRRALGMKIGTLRNLWVESKKLNHALASAEMLAMPETAAGTGVQSEGKPLELVFDGGNKIIRFPDISSLIEFLKRAA